MGTLESFNPATGEPLGSVETTDPGDVQAAVDDVAEVQRFWGELSLRDRGRYLRRTADLLAADLDEVATLLSREQGKPITEAYTMEVVPTIDGLHWLAEEGPEILDDQPVRMGQGLFIGKRARFAFEPLGVVGVIAPWNYPWSIPFGEVAIALMAGNGVVLKPAELTPLIGERIRVAFEKAGVPDGLVRVLHGEGDVGAAITESSVRKVFFTGSVETGYKVGAACAARMKGSVLELGGKDPAIVCADADLQNAISGIVWAGFANAGQTCAGIERVYVVEEVAERFISGVVAETERLRVGDPSSWDVEVGPMVSTDQHEIVCELVDDAIADGAERRCGGPLEVSGSSGKYIEPTVLTGVSHEMRIMREEIFGPVLPIVVVASEEEAIELANDSDFGLGASIWTRDRKKGERMARRIESGMVWINDHAYSHAAMQCAWGGVKDSGLGRTHSRFGLRECVEVKNVTWNSARSRDLWWQPYDRTLGEAVRAAAGLLYGGAGSRVKVLREGGGSLLRTGAKTLRR
ncbi:MAG: aldehyde dehydrogenase family protein [Solirubrobacterales bacterium]|nr:aldehyde dehydrogenase family protein [Solirubrobacterales bacterium]MCB8971892.1 aldehyde dehydrogenase family protein [Thermoleophilales bacterium]MCO5326303.1 aldehyde dehydrogenase family protein [Solirubrobacterales bacterium]